MKKILISIAATITVALSGMSASFAQDGGPPQFRPVEMWACSLKDGKDQDDVQNLYEDIIESSGDSAYAAWQLNPYFVGNLGQNFDFIYLGAWADGSAMGGGLQNEIENGDEEWDETLDCASLMFASNRIQENADAGDGDGNFVLAISDCDVAEGRTAAQAVGAINRFNDYRVANGLTIGTIVWFPVYGGGNADFTFKLVSVFGDGQALGDAFQWSVDNAAYRVQGEMTDGLVSCDESRVYSGSTIMNNIN